MFVAAILCVHGVVAHPENDVCEHDHDAIYICPTMDGAQVVFDMERPSEALPIKPEFEWSYRPMVTMRSPRGDAIPEWWGGNRPTWTRALLSWFTLFEAQDNAAENSAVQVGSLRVFIYSKREQHWVRVDVAHSPEVSLWEYPFRHVAGQDHEPLDTVTHAKKKYKPAYPFFYHGWGRAKEIDAPDIGAVFVAMEFRLALVDSTKGDDRNRAKFLVNVGADYYPDMALRWSLNYAPGVGNGRLLLATNAWRTATFFVMNLNDSTLERHALQSLPVCEDVEN
jgi:hypothetical protein